MSDEELNCYFNILSKDHSYSIQKWSETKNMPWLDEYISHLTEEEKDALFMLLVMKFMNIAEGEEK